MKPIRIDFLNRAKLRITAVCCGVWFMAGATSSLPSGTHPDEGASAVFHQVVNHKCSLEGTTPQMIKIDGAAASEWHGMFDLSDLPQLWEQAEPDHVISQFRDTLRARLDVDAEPRLLLERQRAILARMPEASGDVANLTEILEGRVGNINPIGCLEAMLWKWQTARYPMLEHPTEFGAFVLRGDGRVRVYLSSADLVGQKIRRPVTELVHNDVVAGYRLIAHIHNHPFLFNREVGDRMWTVEATKEDVAGALAPSMTDVQFYQNVTSLRLEEGWVTNGLHTSRFNAGELEALRSR